MQRVKLPCGCWLLVGSAAGWALLALLAFMLRGISNFWLLLVLLWALAIAQGHQR